MHFCCVSNVNCLEPVGVKIGQFSLFGVSDFQQNQCISMWKTGKFSFPMHRAQSNLASSSYCDGVLSQLQDSVKGF